MELKEWIQKEHAVRSTMSKEQLDHMYFYRDPPRPIMSNPDIFFSPADGVLLNQAHVTDPSKPILQVKGRYYSLQDIFEDRQYTLPSLVLEIFMTSWDVHINRISMAGNLSYKELPAISSVNYPMMKTEKNILKGIIGDPEQIQYMKSNQRVLNTVKTVNQTYYILQVADRDASVISPFSIRQGKWFSQGERFSQVRWGSQVDLIIPIGAWKYEFLQKEETHVEAGIDGLVKLTS
jgi:phosphatidylserine decarboxylase